MNANGDRDAGEPGLSGWTINLTGPVSGSTTTDSNGNYEFGNLEAGSYTICEVQQTNWTQTEPASGACHTNVVVGTSDVTGKDFGNTPLSKVDVRFFDLTDATDATISCVEQGDTTSLGSLTVDNESVNPELVREVTNLEIGTYVCTIVITDP